MENTNTLRHYFATHFKDKVIETGIYVLSKRMQNAHISIPMDNSIKSKFKEGGFYKEQGNLIKSAL